MASVATFLPLQSSSGMNKAPSLDTTPILESSHTFGTVKPANTHEPVLYKEQEQLGRGSFGLVHRVSRSTDGQVFAAKTALIESPPDPRIKVLFDKRSKEAIQQLEDEIRNLKMFDHENIIKVVDVKYLTFEAPQMITLLFDGDAEDMLEWEVPQMVVFDLFTDMCSALDYIHDKGYVHMDIKPQNILVRRDGRPDGQLTFHLCDFGGILTSGHEVKSIRARTRNYASPEVLAWSGRYTYAADIWSLMVTVMTLLNEGDISNLLSDKQPDCDLISTVISTMLSSDSLVDFGDCVEKNASDRPTAAQCLTRIKSGKHSFHDLEDLILI